MEIFVEFSYQSLQMYFPEWLLLIKHILHVRRDIVYGVIHIQLWWQWNMVDAHFHNKTFGVWYHRL